MNKRKNIKSIKSISWQESIIPLPDVILTNILFPFLVSTDVGYSLFNLLTFDTNLDHFLAPFSRVFPHGKVKKKLNDIYQISEYKDGVMEGEVCNYKIGTKWRQMPGNEFESYKGLILIEKYVINNGKTIGYFNIKRD